MLTPEDAAILQSGCLKQSLPGPLRGESGRADKGKAGLLLGERGVSFGLMDKCTSLREPGPGRKREMVKVFEWRRKGGRRQGTPRAEERRNEHSVSHCACQIPDQALHTQGLIQLHPESCCARQVFCSQSAEEKASATGGSRCPRS